MSRKCTIIWPSLAVVPPSPCHPVPLQVVSAGVRQRGARKCILYRRVCNVLGMQPTYLEMTAYTVAHELPVIMPTWGAVQVTIVDVGKHCGVKERRSEVGALKEWF